MSITPDITEAIPAPLGGGGAAAPAADPSAWDVTIGGLGFNLRPSAQYPYQRGTEQTRKQQIDISAAPGEQTFTSWWTRSQDSWDMGAGVRFFEPETEPDTRRRFGNSQGVDVWTPGQITLLPKMFLVETGGPEYTAVMYRGSDAGSVRAYIAFGDTFCLDWVGQEDTEAVSVHDAYDLTPPVVAGSTVWVGITDGVVGWTPGDSPDNSVQVITRTWTCSGLPRVWWAKARLIVALGPSLYEVAPNAAPGALLDAGTLLYTHPDSNWVWNGVGETGGAILAAGSSGGSSGIFRFSLEKDELNQPVLSAGSQVAHLPPGEVISCMGVYLGTYLVLGTNRGIRVGFTDEQGTVQYGPITVPLDEPAADILFDDRFAYVAVTRALPDGTTGLVRIDLSAPIGDTGHFPWAWDLSTGGTADALSVCLWNDDSGPRWDINMVGYWASTLGPLFPDWLVDSGWIETGMIRFATAETKAFRLARMAVTLNGGTASMTAIDPSGDEYRVIEFSPLYQTDNDVAIQIPGAPLHTHMSFRVTLTPAGDGTSPVLTGITIKAVPAPTRVRLFQFPLQVFDYERDRYGNWTGKEGEAFLRLKALETLEETGAPVPIRDNRTGESFYGQIDTTDFTSTSPPDGQANGFGGMAVVVVRRL